MSRPTGHTLTTHRLIRRIAILSVSLSLALISACGVSDRGTSAGTSNIPTPVVMPNTTDAIQSPETAVQVQNVKLRKVHVDKTLKGWVLTDQGVLWTDNFTHNLKDKTLPPQVKPDEIGDVFFLDEQHSWLVLNRLRPGATNPADLLVLRSTDNGQSWLRSSLYPDYREYVDQPGEVAGVEFVDPQHGWVMLRNVSSAAVDKGLLFRTTDGGESWSRVSAPSGQPVHFISQQDGWTTNIPLALLYATHDGGITWEKQALPQIAEPTPNGIIPSYELPTFFNDQEGILPVTLAGEQQSISFYTTQDGGRSWNLAAQEATLLPGSPFGTMPTAVVTSQEWMLFLPNGKVRKTSDSGKHWDEQDVPSLAAGITNVSFASQAQGWGLSSVGKCAAPKSQCSIQTQIMITEDGGHTWTATATFTNPS